MALKYRVEQESSEIQKILIALIKSEFCNLDYRTSLNGLILRDWQQSVCSEFVARQILRITCTLFESSNYIEFSKTKRF